MVPIIKREIINYLKRPLFWLGIAIVVFGVFQNVSPYLEIHFLKEGETIVNDYPDTAYKGDVEVYEGYVPSSEEYMRKSWEKSIREVLISEFQMDKKEAEAVISKMQEMDIGQAGEYLEKEYGLYGTADAWQDVSYHKGTREEINSYISKKLEKKPFSYYFSRKFADFAGLFMGFFAVVMLSVLFLQDTRKNTYELLHTKPVSAGKYVAGKIAGGFAVCAAVLVAMDIIFWLCCYMYTRGSGFEVRLFDFVAATAMYILPNMLMIVSVYSLVSLLFKSPLPAAPFLILYIVYSNMGSKNAEEVYGYYGRPLAIMVRFPGQLFDTAPPPLVLLNQGFLILASAIIIFISIQLWKRRRI